MLLRCLRVLFVAASTLLCHPKLIAVGEEFKIVTDVQCSKLVDVQEALPSAVIEVMYATPENFTNAPIYDAPICLAHADIVAALKKVVTELEQKGLVLKIWDAYRPHSAQWKLWDYTRDVLKVSYDEIENYVADPRKGGRHTRGTAIDLTLVDLKTGKELEMPTKFDFFGPQAWRDYMDLPQEVINNRALLQEVMERNGFIGLPSEWWHFDFKGWEQYPVLNVPLK